MPRYFMQSRHAHAGPDEVGRDLPDVEAARQSAVQDLREMLYEDIREGRLDLGHVIDIKDDRGRHVASVPLSDAVELINDGILCPKCAVA